LGTRKRGREREDILHYVSLRDLNGRDGVGRARLLGGGLGGLFLLEFLLDICISSKRSIRIWCFCGIIIIRPRKFYVETKIALFFNFSEMKITI